MKKLTYWLPRIVVIGFILSLALPAPRYLADMSSGTLYLWLARLIWVAGITFLSGVCIAAAGWIQHRRHRPGTRDTGPD